MFAKCLIPSIAAAVVFSMPAWAQEGTEGSEGAETDVAEEVKIDPNAPPSAEPGCFSIRGVRNFSPLSDEHIYVQGQRNTHFLLTMDRGCFNLRSAQGIAIDNVMDRVCSNSQAGIRYRGVGGSIESCRVRQVESVESRDAARTLAELRKQQ